ncbi:MAG: carbohydrate porin [Fuerstiella sp.]|nr:carbohydrate porin [Fuerstiella sp.]MCP4856594.1 carbohydrate porin [Fuerstiella sp.]
MKRQTPGFWLSAVVLCAATMCAEPASGDESRSESPHLITADHLFTESDPWVQTVSLQCADDSPCVDSGASCGEADGRHIGCCDDLLSRTSLTNGLFGLAPAAAQHGVMVDASYTNFSQGVTSGGINQTFRNGSKTDLFLIADTGKLGLWEGGMFQVHVADWQFGENSIGDAAGMAPVNTSLLTPKVTPAYGLTNLLLMQQLGDGWVAAAGRYNATDLWATFYPDYGRGVDGFMNVSTMIPLSSAMTLPFVSNVAGILKMGERGLESGFVVLENQNSPTTVGLDFPNGTTLLGLARKYTDFGGLPGSHTLIGTYGTGDFTSFDTSGWDIIPPGGVVPATSTGTWMATYLAEQRLWVDPCNEKRYAKLFGYVGFSDHENSPFRITTSVSVEAFGLSDSRPNDRMGIAYFYTGLNDDFKSAFGAVTPVGDLQGGEVYYNAQITPWFNLTFDLQAVEPAAQRLDTAVVLGLRAHVRI